MTVPSSHCEAKKHAYRQTKDGIVISFVLHPNEVPDDLTLAPLGARYMLALARIGDDEEPQEPEQKPEKPKRPGRSFADMPPSQQAGMLCNDPAFQAWICPANPDPEVARDFILLECGVERRRDLANSPATLALWTDMITKFRADTGRTAEQRG